MGPGYPIHPTLVHFRTYPPPLDWHLVVATEAHPVGKQAHASYGNAVLLVSTYIVCERDYLWCKGIQKVWRQSLCSKSSEHPNLKFGSEHPPPHWNLGRSWHFGFWLLTFQNTSSPPQKKLKFRHTMAFWALTFQNTTPFSGGWSMWRLMAVSPKDTI